MFKPSKTKLKFYVTQQFERVPIRPSTRWRIGIRDMFCCRYCGRWASPWVTPKPEIDHVVPWSWGGRNWGNLVWACRECNQRKGARVWKPRPLAWWQRVLDVVLMMVYDWPKWEDFKRGGGK